MSRSSNVLCFLCTFAAAFRRKAKGNSYEQRKIYLKIFLKQSRRDKTHGVQLTPHKAKPQCGVGDNKKAKL